MITLVGTVHLDILGTSRLGYILNKYQPRTISIEAPRNIYPQMLFEEIESDKKIYIDQIRKLEISSDFRNLLTDIVTEYGFEIYAAKKYSDKTGAKIFFTDHPDRKCGFNLDVSDFIKGKSKADLDAICSVPYDTLRKEYIKIMDQNYHNENAQRIIENNLSEEQRDAIIKEQKQSLDPAFAEEREQFMFDELRRLAPDMHIGGMMHIFAETRHIHNIHPLYARLKNNNVDHKKIKLCEPDHIYDA